MNLLWFTCYRGWKISRKVASCLTTTKEECILQNIVASEYLSGAFYSDHTFKKELFKGVSIGMKKNSLRLEVYVNDSAILFSYFLMELLDLCPFFLVLIKQELLG